jgi:hypothetical protein
VGEDAFGSRVLDLQRVRGVCVPAVIDGAVVTDPVTHLESYRASVSRIRPAQAKPVPGYMRSRTRWES